MTAYKSLEVWKRAMMIVKEVYLLTKSYPKEELFSLTSQTRRAAISIPANIAEGIGRNFKKDTIQFLHVSRGSLYELETHLDIAVMVGLLDVEVYKPIETLIAEEYRLLNGLIKSYENRVELK